MARQATGVCLVKVVKTGSEVKEFALNGDRTVSAAIELYKSAGIDLGENPRVKVNGKEASETSTVKNGDVITITNNIKGGQA